MSSLVKEFDYYLPPELIAQEPCRPRDHSRLLLLNKKTGEIKHQHFFELLDFLQPGDLLVLNNSKVFPARLIGHKQETGGEVEVFLHQPKNQNTWECLLKGRVKEGLEISFSPSFTALVRENNQDGTWLVKFNLSGQKFWQAINKIGEVPLPPYIKRQDQKRSDRQNYQTVFAADNKIGSAAAPTAGLHLTRALLEKIKARGVKIAYVTLHVGLGTFAPVKTERIQDHKMHRELVEVSASTLKDLQKARQAGRRIIAVGTTSCRALESLPEAELRSGVPLTKKTFWTEIFIYPPYRFKLVNALITNFHLPKSSLVMLVSALAGQKNIKQAYQEAIKEKYRFFSYGDAMFIY